MQWGWIGTCPGDFAARARPGASTEGGEASWWKSSAFKWQASTRRSGERAGHLDDQRDRGRVALLDESNPLEPVRLRQRWRLPELRRLPRHLLRPFPRHLLHPLLRHLLCPPALCSGNKKREVCLGHGLGGRECLSTSIPEGDGALEQHRLRSYYIRTYPVHTSIQLNWVAQTDTSAKQPPKYGPLRIQRLQKKSSSVNCLLNHARTSLKH